MDNEPEPELVDNPPIESVLYDQLQLIIDSKHYTKELDPWTQILSNINMRLQDIVNSLPDTATSSKQLGTQLQIHLETQFPDSPPFTVLRLAEIILRPESEGYDVGTVNGVAKYFNALAKVIFVNSNVDEFPEPNFIIDEVKEEGIPLIKIPWLDTSKL